MEMKYAAPGPALLWGHPLPKGWESKRLKHFAEVTLGKMLESNEFPGALEKPYLRAQNVRWGDLDLLDLRTMWFGVRERRVLQLRAKDLLVSEGGEVGRTAIWEEAVPECYFQNSVNRVRVKGDPRYYRYVFEAAGFLGIFEQAVNRVSIAHLTRDKLREIAFPVPPFSVQASIADFLDREIGEIRRIAGKKRELVRLLEEEKLSLVTQSVTTDGFSEEEEAVSGNRRMVRLKDVAKIRASNVDKKIHEGEGLVSLCNYVDVYKNEFITGALDFMEASASTEQKKKLGLMVGDVLITKDSESPDDIGVPALVRGVTPNLVLGYHLYLIRPNAKVIDPDYLLRFLQSHVAKTHFDKVAKGITRFSLDAYSVGNISISLPPLARQKIITKTLRAATDRTEKAISILTTQLNKLEEYRTSLIYSAVTGRVNCANI